MQEQCGGGLHVCGADLPGAVQPAFPLVEVAHPDGQAGDRAKRGCEYRSIVQAIAFGQGYRLAAAFSCCGHRDQLRRKALIVDPPFER
jgi:hypothetical protein